MAHLPAKTDFFLLMKTYKFILVMCATIYFTSNHYILVLFGQKNAETQENMLLNKTLLIVLRIIYRVTIKFEVLLENRTKISNDCTNYKQY